jgi:hypothetical protein
MYFSLLQRPVRQFLGVIVAIVLPVTATTVVVVNFSHCVSTTSLTQSPLFQFPFATLPSESFDA